MYQNIKHFVATNLRNIRGWQTERKIVVIESDDWGSIRMPSETINHELLKAGIRVDTCAYNSYDSLESEDDLSALFNVLKGHKDSVGNKPVFTADTIVANPDFEKIRASGFNEYHYELFTETYKRYPNHSNSFALWKQGMHEGVFFPQFHGREHLNVNRWINGLQNNLPETHMAFDSGLFGIGTRITSEKRRSYLAALDFDSSEEIDNQKLILVDGLNQFEKLFGYRSSSYVATNYIWHRLLEPELAKAGIRYIQGLFRQYEPKGNNSDYNIIRHDLGEQNNSGQYFLIRNCAFEPSLINSSSVVETCLKEITTAFTWGKPAIISSHRLNFIGSIVPQNRKKNLELLDELLKRIILKWPQVEFMTSVELGDLISAKS